MTKKQPEDEREVDGDDEADASARPATSSTPSAEAPTVEEWQEVQARALRAEALEARVEELEDRVKRSQADFLNETRRIARQADADKGYAIQRVVVDLLPVVDAVHQAEEAIGDSPEAERLREGLRLIGRQLEDALKRHGVERIDAMGKPFDPAWHEAFMMVDQPELPPGTVAQVVRPGFSLHGRVVRPAHVAVTRPSPAKRAGPEAPGA